VFSGAARVFDSREQALAALAERKIKPGEVCVVRYEGAKGPAGFRSISAVARELARQGLAGRVALVTDGCCGDTPELLSAELVSPEAMDGSPLAAVKDGDRIDLDPAARDLKINLTDTDLKIRLVRWQPPVMRPRTSFWSRYARAVGPVLQGACQS
jgi:dihydroxy-acid dehydratase